MMRQAPPGVPADSDESGATEPPETPATAARPLGEKPENRLVAPRSLFDLMQRGDHAPPRREREPGDEAEHPETPLGVVRKEPAGRSGDDLPVGPPFGRGDAERFDREAERAEPDDDRTGPSLSGGMINPDDLEPPRYLLAARQARRQGWFGLASGLAAVVASALSLSPNVLAGIPATALGFVAIIAGYLVLTGPGRREISRAMRGLTLFGMLLGTAGIFLGPLLFAGLGRNLRESSGQLATHRHLLQMGEGLGQYYTQNDGYPIGGTFARDETGTIRGQHGWMTALLPFVGESELYRKIDLTLPYDDAVNRPAMGTNVGVYFAAGGDRARIGDGFAVSHFAGLGGEIDDASGLSHVGIFERDVAVKREEITDGLSNTLIVGELAGTYPPWGDPENWRMIGRGLNKDVDGFGSYSGHGASFLLADGTVKFFSNKTDPRLLKQLSTRNGGE